MSDEKDNGRPSAYDPKYCEMIIEYFSKDPYKEKFKKITTRSGDVIEVPYDAAADTPTLAGFACKIGHHRDTLHEWSKVHKEFSEAVKKAKDFQENFMVINGNKGLINPQFGILTMKNICNWRDRLAGEDTKVVINNFTSKSDEEIEVRYQELMAKNAAADAAKADGNGQD